MLIHNKLCCTISESLSEQQCINKLCYETRQVENVDTGNMIMLLEINLSVTQAFVGTDNELFKLIISALLQHKDNDINLTKQQSRVQQYRKPY